jgi:hypothetical protein
MRMRLNLIATKIAKILHQISDFSEQKKDKLNQKEFQMKCESKNGQTV